MNLPLSAIKPPRRNKKIVLGSLLALIVIAAAITGVVTGLGSTDQDTKREQKAQFTDWLKPTQTIKVGEYRYVSLCQALPLSSVTAIYGDFEKDSTINENYIDASQSQGGDSLKSSVDVNCEYDYGKSSGQSVKLLARQYFDDKTVDSFSSALYTQADEAETAVARYEKAAQNGNSDAKSFAKTLRSSLTTYKNADQNPAADNAPISTYNGTLLADGRSLASNRFEFDYKFNNSIYTLKYTLPDASRPKTTDTITDQQLAQVMTLMQKTIKALETNLKNSNLSQSAAPTVTGVSDKFGSTTLLDACSIDNTASFTVLHGKADNSPIRHFGMTPDVSEAGNKMSTLPAAKSSICGRTFSDELANQTLSGDITLYTSWNATDATDRLKGYFSQRTDDTAVLPIQTKADETIRYQGEGKAEYYFRVGAYVVIFSPSASSGGGFSSEFTRLPVNEEAAVAAINKMVDNINADLQKAK